MTDSGTRWPWYACIAHICMALNGRRNSTITTMQSATMGAPALVFQAIENVIDPLQLCSFSHLWTTFMIFKTCANSLSAPELAEADCLALALCSSSNYLQKSILDIARTGSVVLQIDTTSLIPLHHPKLLHEKIWLNLAISMTSNSC